MAGCHCEVQYVAVEVSALLIAPLFLSTDGATIQHINSTSAIAAAQRDVLAIDQMDCTFAARPAPYLLDVAKIHDR